MPLPPSIEDKIRNRFGELIDEAEMLIKTLELYERKETIYKSDLEIFNIVSPANRRSRPQPPEKNHVSECQAFVVKCCGLVSTVFGDSWEGREERERIERLHPYASLSIREIRGIMQGLFDNFISGFCDHIEKQIRESVSADYMEQAEALLKEGFLVPAAVVCGAVLENRLRSYCDNLDPPIETLRPNGESKTLGALIGELDRVKAFDKQTRKMLRAWADIRNAAAHGRFDDFTREQVELMLLGVNGFFANHL